MKLSRSDWVLLGSGHLYSAPFVSRHLLFRLFDIDRSLLFSEEPGAETSHTTLEKDEQKRILRIQSVPRKAKTIHLYSSSSATVALEELSKSTPIEIPLEDFRQEVVIDGILMTLTPCQLPSSRAHVLSTGEDQPVSYEIAETFYNS